MMQQMGSAVVFTDIISTLGIDLRCHCVLQSFRKGFTQMDNQVILFFHVKDPSFVTASIHQPTGVADLSAAFGVERGDIQNDLVKCTVFLAHLSVANHLGRAVQAIVPHKSGRDFIVHGLPVVGSNSGSCP